MRNRDTAKQRAMKSIDSHNWADYKRLRKMIINGKVKSTKKSLFTNSFIESNGNS